MEEIYSAWKVEQINDRALIHRHKSNNIKIGVYDMTVNDSEMCVIWKDEAWSIPEFGLVWFILRPCQHHNGYIDGWSQIKVHTDEDISPEMT